MTQKLAVFDLDETIIDGDSVTLWLHFLLEKGVINNPSVLDEDKRLMAEYVAGTLDINEYMKFVIMPLQVLSMAEVDELACEFAEQFIRPLVFPQVTSVLQDLKSDGVPILIISATVSFLVKPIAKMLGVDEAIGIDLKCAENKYTHHIQGSASFREGKVVRLREWLKLQPVFIGHICFYTDSINDLPLCQFADEVYTVNPCPLLMNEAMKQQWPVLEWSR
ncbi:HAD-IB family hydrolase [Vibrio sp. Of7-15]|uniref:HAD family hydrolase n=1 Tax=Vibrio sp. Of7-15 TaxID=2724879 RepID=UPI001EF1DF28|nr:HAD family hydrolase [Vibrio sp. Of7-15]MCG7499821.1 HAD-IB family hydrolase [Vibrio sp. Of7-15]